MIELGKYNELEVARFVSIGVYLTDGKDDILLPLKYVPYGTKVGDKIKVFVYKDSEDRPIATTLSPFATIGEFAYLTVNDTSSIGAFLDWGIAKDIFVPFKEQEKKMETGNRYLVYIYIDEATDRVVASAKYTKFLDKEHIELEEGEEVSILIAKKTDMGYNVIINNRYQGLLFENDIFENIRLGDTKEAYIKKIREDKKIDVTLRKTGVDSIDDAKKTLLDKLKSSDGFLPLTDNSDPEQIKRQLKMSKKIFKKAVGGLFKEKVITIESKGIRLV